MLAAQHDDNDGLKAVSFYLNIFSTSAVRFSTVPCVHKILSILLLFKINIVKFR